MDPMSLEDLALLEVLERVDQWEEPGPNSGPLRQRLIDGGLAMIEDDSLRLTDAGIERCKSLHHRVAADAEAELIIRQREEVEAAEASQAAAELALTHATAAAAAVQVQPVA